MGYNIVMYKLESSPRIQNIEDRFGDSIKKILYTFHWQDNLKHSEIAEKIGVPRSTVTKWFYRFSIPTQSCTRFTNLNLKKHREWLREHKKPKLKREFPWHFNKNFFETWSNEMAYVLGFLIADGYVFTNPRGSNYFGFTSTDKEIIEKIRVILESNHKIGIRKSKNSNRKTRYVLQIGSKKIVKKLKEFGIVQNKSLIIEFPKNIPNKFLRHFVRGYFDGDGGVYLKQHWRKDRNKLNWVFQTYFVAGNKQYLEGLHVALKEYTERGFISQKQRGYALVFSRRDGFSLFRTMYQGVSKEMFLERKYNIFLKAVEVLK